MAVEVLSIEPIGESPAWDVANLASDVADGQGNFVISWLVVHNSIPEAMANRDAPDDGWKQALAAVHPDFLAVLEATYGTICYHEDTRISLADGRELPIREVVAGQLVHSLNMETKRVEIKPVQKCIPTFYTVGLRIKLTNGYELTVTDGHEMVGWGGKVKARDLKVGDLIATPTILPVDGMLPNYGQWLGDDCSVAYLLGQLSGDGQCSGTSSTVVVGDREALADKFIDWVGSHTNLACNKYYHCRSWYVGLSSPEQDPVAVSLPPFEDAAEWWRNAYSRYSGDRIAKAIGRSTWLAYDRIRKHCTVTSTVKHPRRSRWQSFLRAQGMKVSLYYKRVPESIMTATGEVRAWYIAGLIDSDGTISTSGLSHITSESPLLLDDVRKLLLAEGIANHLTGNRLYIWDTERLHDLVGDKLLFKTFDGRPLRAGGRVGVVPREVARQVALEKFGSFRECSRRTGIGRHTLSYKSPYVHTSTALRVGVHLGDVRYYEIASIERSEPAQFWDLAVADNHTLVANGMFSGNCYQEQLATLWQRIAGFTAPEAQDARKAVAKKWKHLLEPIEKKWMEGASKSIGAAAAKEWWAKMVTFGRYAFNRCLHEDTPLTDLDTGETRAVGEWYDSWEKPGRMASYCDGEVVPDECVEIHCNGEQETFEVAFDDGSVERVTLNHRFLCVDGEMHTVAEIFERGLDVVKTSPPSACAT